MTGGVMTLTGDEGETQKLGITGTGTVTLSTDALLDFTGNTVRVGQGQSGATALGTVTIDSGAELKCGTFKLGGDQPLDTPESALNMDGGTLTCSKMEVGRDSSYDPNDADPNDYYLNAVITLTGDPNLTVVGNMELAENGGGYARVNMGGGVINVGGILLVAKKGEAVIDMTSGNLDVAGDINMAEDDGGSGTVNVTDGTIDVGGSLNIGAHGEAFITMDGGNLDVTGDIEIGDVGGCTDNAIRHYLTLNGTAAAGDPSVTVGGNVLLGKGHNCELDIDGGTVAITGDLLLSANGTARSLVDVKEGLITVGTYTAGAEHELYTKLGTNGGAATAAFGQATIMATTLDFSEFLDDSDNYIRLKPGGLLTFTTLVLPTGGGDDPNTLQELIDYFDGSTSKGIHTNFSGTSINGKDGLEVLGAGEEWGVIIDPDYPSEGMTALYIGAVYLPPDCLNAPAGDLTDDCICDIDDLGEFVDPIWLSSPSDPNTTLHGFADISETWLECGLDKECPVGTKPTEY